MKHLEAIIGSSFLDGDAISAKVYSIVQSFENAMSSINTTVSEWNRRASARRDLARLSPRILKDIGLTAFDVEVEINKPFWKK